MSMKTSMNLLELDQKKMTQKGSDILPTAPQLDDEKKDWVLSVWYFF